MSIQHVLVIATNAKEIGPHMRPTGYFFPEIAHPFDVFSKAGIALEYVTPKGGSSPSDGFDETDAAQRAFRDSKSIRRLSHSRKLTEVDVLDYDAVFIPGGLGPMVDIARNLDVQAAVARAWNAGMIVGAVCHGPCGLLGVTLEDGSLLVKGKRVTGFSNAEEDGYASEDVPFRLETGLADEGAKFQAAAPWQPNVVVDGRLITGQNPASAGPLAEAMVAAMRSTPK